MKRLLILAAFLVTGCVTSADLRRLEDAQGIYELEAEARWREYRDGTITEEEYQESLEVLQRERAAELAAVKEEIHERTQAALERLERGPITGSPLIDILIGGATTAAAGAFGLNYHRNVTRQRALEKVASEA